jgi:lipopolysaccharide export system permease protein
MLRIQRALLAEMLFVFVVITSVVTGAVFAAVAFRFVREGGGALGTELLISLLPSLLPVSLTYGVPFAWLATTALVLGRWVADHECVALQVAGVHLRVVVVPLLALAALFGVGGMIFSGYHVPVADREITSNLREFVPKFLSSLRGIDRSITFNSGRLSFGRWDEKNQTFLAVEADRRGPDGELSTKAMMQSLSLSRIEDRGEDRLQLETQGAFLLRVADGRVQADFSDEAPIVMGHVERIGASTLFNDFFGEPRYLYRPRSLTLPELIYADARGGVALGSVTEARIAMHGRLALGAASFFLTFFALSVLLVVPPSGRRIRDFMLCFLPAVLIFFPLQMAGPSIARSTWVPPWLAMWSPDIVLGLVASVLLAKAFRR